MPDPSADRLIYATFPPSLREAMKVAAQRFEWTREDWQMQTTMIQKAMIDGWYTADKIAAAYATAPPRNEA